jgi:hypothetical protein
MATCGLWPSKRGIVAVVADDYGAAVRPVHTAPRTAEAYWAMLADIEALQGLDCRFVITDEALADHARLGHLAARRGSHMLVVSSVLVDGVRVLGGATRAPPKKLALLLARLPLCPPLAGHLEPLRLQLDLL